MYRRPKFLEILLDIRQEMAREADYDADLFAEIVRSGRPAGPAAIHSMDEPEKSNAKASLVRRSKSD